MKKNNIKYGRPGLVVPTGKSSRWLYWKNYLLRENKFGTAAAPARAKKWERRTPSS